MSTIAIFVLGLFVSVITFAAALLVGLTEASDPSQSRLQDLMEFEKQIVDRDNSETASESSKTKEVK